MRPEPGKAIADPACGTGGFLLGACDFLNDPEHYRLDRQQKELLKYDTWRRLLAQFRKLAAGLEKG